MGEIDVSFLHHGEPVDLRVGSPMTFALPPVVDQPEPPAPPGRAVARRRDALERPGH